jgi:dTMP kinase
VTAVGSGHEAQPGAAVGSRGGNTREAFPELSTTHCPLPTPHHPLPTAPRGVFITLEGPEGGGKTTLAPLLAEHLRSRGYDVVTCAEPGGGPIPQAIRALLLHPDRTDMAPRTELLLFLAARAQQIQDTIAPALAAGRIVVSDRYSDSTLAYQAYAGGLPVDQVEAAVAFATGDLWPDLTLLLDLPPEVGLARQGDRNRMENKGIEFHRRVREGFLELWRRHPERIRLIDAARELAEARADVFHQVQVFLG